MIINMMTYFEMNMVAIVMKVIVMISMKMIIMINVMIVIMLINMTMICEYSDGVYHSDYLDDSDEVGWCNYYYGDRYY